MEDTFTPHVALWAGALIAALGTLLLGWALRMLRRRQRRKRLARHTTGTVVDNRITTDMENSRLVYPIVEFATDSGESIRVECAWSTQVRYPVGTRVPVYYNPDKPQEAEILGEGELGPVLLTGVAASLLALGLLLLAAGALGFPPSQ